MRKMSEIKNHTNWQPFMTHELNIVFGENDFSTALFNIINEVIDDYVVFDYHTWLYGDDEQITNNNLSRYTSFIHRHILRKYKYIEYFRQRWTLENGTKYGDKQTKNKTTDRDRELGVNSTRTLENAHNSNTNMNYTQNSNSSEAADTAVFDTIENSPLGVGDVQTMTTPYNKAKSSTNTTNDTDLSRTDTQDITVESGDTSSNVLESTTIDDITDVENEVVEYENGVEILKAMKYNNLSIMEVIQDIVDRTVYEFNEVL